MRTRQALAGLGVLLAGAVWIGYAWGSGLAPWSQSFLGAGLAMLMGAGLLADSFGARRARRRATWLRRVLQTGDGQPAEPAADVQHVAGDGRADLAEKRRAMGRAMAAAMRALTDPAPAVPSSGYERARLLHEVACGGMFWPEDGVPTCERCGCTVVPQGA